MLKFLQFLRDHTWSAVPAEPTARERRIAAIAWPVFLVLIGTVIVWRRTRADLPPVSAAPAVLWTLAPVLALVLAFGGRAGAAVYRTVMLVFATLGFFVSHVLMIVFFYLVVTPLGLALRLFGKDLIDTRRDGQPRWTPHTPVPERRRFYRQY